MDDILISRIDRAVADNIKDIKRSFGSQSGLVQDFIVFISTQIKIDLFGFTRFTIQQFCKHTGRNRQDLVIIHPEFASGLKQPPVINGYAFQSVFEFTLYTMLEKNIIFSSKYEFRNSDAVLQMHSFPILKDLRLNHLRKINEQKIYDVRLSDELMHGFLTRYYTLNAESYKLVGKGRGGESRKKFLLYLSKLSHVVTSGATGQNILITVDRLCEFGDITDVKPSHRKQNLIRMLNYIQKVGKLPFDYHFESGQTQNDYLVRLTFHPQVPSRMLMMEHSFYFRLLTGLKDAYMGTNKKNGVSDDPDPFQLWLADRYLDLSLKARVLSQAYYRALGLNISEAHSCNLITAGAILQPLVDVR